MSCPALVLTLDIKAKKKGHEIFFSATVQWFNATATDIFIFGIVKYVGVDGIWVITEVGLG
jgi:hypothetical protein